MMYAYIETLTERETVVFLSRHQLSRFQSLRSFSFPSTFDFVEVWPQHQAILSQLSSLPLLTSIGSIPPAVDLGSFVSTRIVRIDYRDFHSDRLSRISQLAISFPNLTDLRVNVDTQITFHSIDSYLTDLTSLKALRIGFYITQRTTSVLTRLESLYLLSNKKVATNTLQHLPQTLTKLRMMTCGDSIAFTFLTNLQSLGFYHRSCENGCASISHLTSLKSLIAYSFSFSFDDVANLPLSKLSFGFSGFPRWKFQTFRHLTSLRGSVG